MSHSCAALSSAQGTAGVAVIRISGDDAIDVASKVFKPANSKNLHELPSNHMAFGTIYGADGEKIDTGMCVCFHAPKSYTGENTAEISCHGSPIGVSMILAALFSAGAKPALPGEFTKRAFVNGKLDLTQAEAVAELLEAKNTASLKLSGAKLEGGLGRDIREISDRITYILSSVYAFIDYPDEDMSDMSDGEILSEIEALRKKLTRLCNTYSTGLAVTNGVKTVIAGLPNTGKSTFFNLLSGYDRAIVTDTAGTTRDVITENVSVAGLSLLVSDTAGIRDTDDKIEKIGVERSREALEDAELLFTLFDVSKELSPEDKEFAETVKGLSKNTIVVLNKCDKMESDADADSMREYFTAMGFENICVISADTGEGKDKIEEAVKKIFPITDEELKSGAVLTNARQYTAVNEALLCLTNAENAMRTLTRDMAGLDLEGALGALCEADGRQVSEEIVASIFSHFCVGK